MYHAPIYPLCLWLCYARSRSILLIFIFILYFTTPGSLNLCPYYLWPTWPLWRGHTERPVGMESVVDAGRRRSVVAKDCSPRPRRSICGPQVGPIGDSQRRNSGLVGSGRSDLSLTESWTESWIFSTKQFDSSTVIDSERSSTRAAAIGDRDRSNWGDRRIIRQGRQIIRRGPRLSRVLQTAVGTARGIGLSMVPESVGDHPDQFPDCSDLSPGATPTDSDRERSTGSTSDSTTQLEFKSQEFYAVDSVGDLNYSASNL